MARQSRFIVPGQPHLVIQRGHGGSWVFHDLTDARDYLACLTERARVHDVRIHAYGLYASEAILLASPMNKEGLPRLMQAVARRYAQHFNARHGRSGTPWHGRYGSAPIDPDSLVVDAMRFVEMATTHDRSSLIASSEAHHTGAGRDGSLTDHPAYWLLGNTPFDREAAYGALVREPLPDAMARNMRAAAINGWPQGSVTYLQTLSQQAERPAAPGRRGRPARK